MANLIPNGAEPVNLPVKETNMYNYIENGHKGTWKTKNNT